MGNKVLLFLAKAVGTLVIFFSVIWCFNILIPE